MGFLGKLKALFNDLNWSSFPFLKWKKGSKQSCVNLKFFAVTFSTFVLNVQKARIETRFEKKNGSYIAGTKVDEVSDTNFR